MKKAEYDGSVMLSIEFKVTSVTAWVADMRENHLHALLSGFIVGDTPGSRSVKSEPATVWKTASGIVNATAFIVSLIATSVGIHTGTVITSVTTYKGSYDKCSLVVLI
ncbi:MAG: hypothetical protein IJT34_06035 [Butyrivibrio sp.]|nr:hypothetical protein [Butyrivibrio sp.]